VEYSPDPEYKALRDEKKYVRKHAGPKDTEAAGALKKIDNAVGHKRRKAAVEKAFDNAPMPDLPDF
jgi:hypothetical protein